MEQQRPCTCSGMPSRPARRRWFQSWRVRPTSSYPSSRSMAATVEESTPPDMATATVLLNVPVMKGQYPPTSLVSHPPLVLVRGPICDVLLKCLILFYLFDTILKTHWVESDL